MLSSGFGASKCGAITPAIRRTFHAVNFLLFATGVTSLTMGAYFHANPPSRRNAVINNQHIVAMIIVGLFTILTSFLGLWASLDPLGRVRSLRAYPVLLVVITIAMITMGLKVWGQTLTMHTTFSSNWIDGVWDDNIRLAFQDGGSCCGFFTTAQNFVPSPQCFVGTNLPPCAAWVWGYGETYLRNIYTCLFALVGVCVLAFLCGLVMCEVQAEEARYIRIRGKIDLMGPRRPLGRY